MLGLGGGAVGVIRVMSPMSFMKLFCAIFPFEFMAFAGDKEGAGGRKDWQKEFHLAFLLAAPAQNATLATQKFHAWGSQASTARAARSWVPAPPSMAAVCAKRVCSLPR